MCLIRIQLLSAQMASRRRQSNELHLPKPTVSFPYPWAAWSQLRSVLNRLLATVSTDTDRFNPVPCQSFSHPRQHLQPFFYIFIKDANNYIGDLSLNVISHFILALIIALAYRTQAQAEQCWPENSHCAWRCSAFISSCIQTTVRVRAGKKQHAKESFK